MLDAYRDRKRRELHEEGAVQAIAQHDPRQLDQLAQPAARAGQQGSLDPDWRKGLGLTN